MNNEDINNSEKELEGNMNETPNEEKNEEKDVKQEESNLQDKLDDEKNKFLRLYAEFENYKKRTLREKDEFHTYANQSLISDLLPVLDDFERALKELAKNDDDDYYKGVQLIQQKLIETLQKKGLKKINVEVGDAFDTELHEAITTVAVPDEDMKGKLIDIIETGYQLGDRIIRFPKVVVGK